MILTMELTNESNVINLNAFLKSWTSLKFNSAVVTTIPSNTEGILEIENAVALNTYDTTGLNLAITNVRKVKGYLDTINTTNMRNAFKNCKLIEVNIEFSSVANLTDTYGMFTECPLIDIVRLKRFNTINLQNMSSMFKDCGKLEIVNLQGFKTDKVTNASSMFLNCSSLQYINMSDWNLLNLTDMSNMFNNCVNLEVLNIGIFNNIHYINLTNTFLNCNKIREVYSLSENTSPSDIRTLLNILMNLNLELIARVPNKVNYETYLKDYLQLHVRYAEDIVPTTLEIIIDNTATTINLNTCLKSWTSLKFNGNVVSSIPPSTAGKIEIENAVALNIYSTSSSFSVGIPSMIELRGALDMTNTTKSMNMFYNCSKLNYIDMEYFKTTENLTDVFGMFNGCSSLKLLDISSLNLHGVTRIDWFCKNCSSLKVFKSLAVYNTYNFSLVTTCSDMFSGCTNLKYIDLSFLREARVSQTTGMFRNCTSLIEVKNFDMDTTSLYSASEMFANCSSLTSLNLDSFTGYSTDVGGMFYNCSSLEKINLMSVTSINNYSNMFFGCVALTEIDLSGKDNNIVSIICNIIQSISLKNMTVKISDISKVEGLNYPNMQFVYPEIENRIVTKYTYDTSKAYDWHNKYPIITTYGYKTKTPVYTEKSLGGTLLEITISLHVCDKIRNISFQNIAGLINLLELNLSELKSLENFFQNNNNVQSLNLKNLNTKNIYNFSKVFYGSYKHNVLDLSNFDTRNMVLAYNLLSSYDVLEGSFSNFDTFNLVNAYCMFSQCRTSNLDLSNFDMVNVVNIYGMFMGSEDLSTIKLFPLKTGKVKDMGYLFRYSYNVKLTVTHFKDWIFTNVVSAEDMFSDSSLSSIDISKFINLENAKGMLSGTNVVNINTSTLKKINNFQGFFSGCRELKVARLNITNKIDNLSTLFYDCPQLESINIEEWDTSNVTNMYALFYGCEKLKISSFATLDFTNVTNVSSMFKYTNFTESLYRTLDISKLKTMDTMFAGILNESIDLSFLNISHIKNFNRLFSECPNLINLTMPKFPTTEIIDINDIFFSSEKLKNIDFSVFDDIKINGFLSFSYCFLENIDLSKVKCQTPTSLYFGQNPNLKEVKFPYALDGGALVVENLGYVFSNCPKIEKIDLRYIKVNKNSYTGKFSADSTFANCSSLKEVYFPIMFNSDEKIDSAQSLFANCSSLEYVDFGILNIADMPSELESYFYYDMFEGCSKLKTLKSSVFEDDYDFIDRLYRILSMQIPNVCGGIETIKGHISSEGGAYPRIIGSSWEYVAKNDTKAYFKNEQVLSRYLGNKRIYNPIVVTPN
ncbi:MAG: BspA family leucine-rich repeat surface protein [Peptostreptococcaceae bacterium]